MSSQELGGNLGGGITVDGVAQGFETGLLIDSSFTCTPNEVTAGRITALQLAGTNTAWEDGVTIPTVSGTGITINSFLVFDAATASLNIYVDPNAPLGARTITLNTVGLFQELDNAFVVLSSIRGGGINLRKKRKSEETAEEHSDPDWQPAIRLNAQHMQRKKYSL